MRRGTGRSSRELRQTERQIVATATAARSLDEFADVVPRAQDYAGRAKSPRTVKAYAADWRDFTTWCTGRHLQALPATDKTVALYLADLADRGTKAATLARRLAAISQRTRQWTSPARPARARSAASTPAFGAPTAPLSEARRGAGRRPQEDGPEPAVQPQGRRLGIPYGSSEQTCPVRAVQAWLQAAHIERGPAPATGRPLRPRPGPAPVG